MDYVHMENISTKYYSAIMLKMVPCNYIQIISKANFRKVKHSIYINLKCSHT